MASPSVAEPTPRRSGRISHSQNGNCSLQDKRPLKPRQATLKRKRTSQGPKYKQSLSCDIDIQPERLDPSVTFASVGGLTKHINLLREMVSFPWLIPDFFKNFNIPPPRGVLFHGAPGTGKTLVARAMANECATGARKVSFFMRNGADCLDMWVGESEKNMRLLFDKAYQMRPSIIFFDELDGLAPVRSGHQDQIHTSIVSTLLTLMDGLTPRGDVIVIGATNRPNSIDPALRRPGRFDREFLFPLPSLQAREEIISTHTRGKAWAPLLSPHFITHLAQHTDGYSGADLRLLCSESVFHALRRCCPQVTCPTFQNIPPLDVSTIVLDPSDFERALRDLVPTAQHAATVSTPARRLDPLIAPLLDRALRLTSSLLEKSFPVAELCKDPSVHTRVETANNGTKDKNTPTLNTLSRCPTFRPRLLLVGSPDQGQTKHLAPALLEKLGVAHVHLLNRKTLSANFTLSHEQTCTQIVLSAIRTTPSIIYVPNITHLWDTTDDNFHCIFTDLLDDIDEMKPVLVLATSKTPFHKLPAEIQDMFCEDGQIYSMDNPYKADRKMFFSNLLLNTDGGATRQSHRTRSATHDAKPTDATASQSPKQKIARSSTSMQCHTDPGTDTDPHINLSDTDAAKLNSILQRILKSTTDFTVVQLRRLYVRLATIIYHAQRTECGLSRLLTDLEVDLLKLFGTT